MGKPGFWRAGPMAAFLRQLSLFDPPAPPSQAVIPVPEAASQASGSPPSPGPSGPLPGGSPAFSELCRGPYARIQVIEKPRLHAGWRVTWVRRLEALRLEIPARLSEAPRETKLALLEWALLVSRRGRKDKAERRRRGALEETIRGALKGPGGPGASARADRRLARLNPKGEFHDLQAIFAAVNARYFGGALEARITWSARFGGLSTHAIAHDGQGRPYHLLTISRGYDDPEATPEIVGGVVYHECLHIAIPPRAEGGRRVVHGPDFRAREREYEHFHAWRKWHREGLPKALRRLRKRWGSAGRIRPS